jgi:hypothetical protein
MTWREAAITALEGAGPITPEQVTKRIAELGLRDITGNTPEATVGAQLYIAVRDGDPRVRQSAPGLFEHTGSSDSPQPPGTLGRIELVHPRDIWNNEARDFTPWLLDNADVLSDALGIEMEFERREHGVGAFSVDIFGRDLTHECPLIVENQLEDTDHRHLGQLLTYAAGTDALTVIWVAPRFRDEHRQALDYLNHMAGDSARFFGVEIKLAVIGDSVPAPMLTLSAKPSDWRSRLQAQKASSGLSEAQLLNLEFWTRYLEHIHDEHPGLTNVKSPQKTSWMNLNFLGNGINVIGSFLRGRELACELYIDTGDAPRNAAILHELASQKAAIETAIGSELLWQPLETKRACRIRLTRPGAVADQSQWDESIAWLSQHQIRFKQVFKPLVSALDPNLGETSPGEDDFTANEDL